MGSSEAAIRARLADHALYLRDKREWARQAAPRWVARMQAESSADKQESWRIAGPELRAELRRIAEADRRESNQ